jgi:glycosyltransferase involved in cell wall biosynthesis
VEPAEAVQYCPFPLDRAVYSSDSNLRAKARNELEIGPKDLMILYTGRISLQKNSVRLISEAVKFAQKSGAKVQLLMAGAFDDLGAPFFGVELKKGFYYQRWRAFLDRLGPAEREVVRYLGQVGPTELKSLYNAADLYFSLSLHHDEDYGMSPAEALCCGTPCALTSWGGYASFVLENEHNACDLIPVELQRDGIAIDSGLIQESLLRQSRVQQTAAARTARSEAYLDALSVEAAEKRIRAFHESAPPDFQGFNWLMQKHAESFSSKVLFPDGPKKGTFYEEIYGSYIQG